MNEDKKIIRDFWNSRSQTFDKSPGHYAASKEEEEAWKLLLRSKLGDAKKVLDVGSGTGFLSLMLGDMGYEVVGVDLSEKMIALASAKAKKKGFSIDFHQDDAEQLGFENNSFDAIVNRAVLWTLPHPEIAVREWMRVLRPGGRLCFFLHGPRDDRGIAIQKQVLNIWILLSERRNPWRTLGSGGQVVNLPYNGGVKPGVIVDLLKSARYSHVLSEPMHEIETLKRQRVPYLYRISHGHGQFCYTAEKPKED
jgi:SAM-dependent methyltransferase